MTQSITPPMTVTIVTTTKTILLNPSVTISETPPMGIGVEGQNTSIDLRPE